MTDDIQKQLDKERQELGDIHKGIAATRRAYEKLERQMARKQALMEQWRKALEHLQLRAKHAQSRIMNLENQLKEEKP